MVLNLSRSALPMTMKVTNCPPCSEDAVISATGPVTISGNEARYRGGAIYNEGTVVLPADADISDNVAVSVSLASGLSLAP